MDKSGTISGIWRRPEIPQRPHQQRLDHQPSGERGLESWMVGRREVDNLRVASTHPEKDCDGGVCE